MIFVVTFLLIINTVLLVVIAASLGKVDSGYEQGKKDAVENIQMNMARHRDIVPDWIIEWVGHIGKHSNLTDLPNTVDYSLMKDIK